MIVTKEELEKYSGVYPDEENNSQELYIESAEDILSSYLGYCPEATSYSKLYDGNGFSDLRLGAKPIFLLESVFIDGVEQDLKNLDFYDDSIIIKNGIFPVGRKNIAVKFAAGFNKIPAIMKMTVLRIATLLQLESDSNIGVSSRSFQDNTRTFLNTKNYEPYLIQCSSYKLLA